MYSPRGERFSSTGGNLCFAKIGLHRAREGESAASSRKDEVKAGIGRSDRASVALSESISTILPNDQPASTQLPPRRNRKVMPFARDSQPASPPDNACGLGNFQAERRCHRLVSQS